MTKFSDLLGKTIKEIHIAVDKESVEIRTEDGKSYGMHHQQNCCESVALYDVCGDLIDVIGSPILLAEEVVSDSFPDDVPTPNYSDSNTWTFYKLSTIKGSVTMRWLGTSNGYYSESVDFYEN